MKKTITFLFALLTLNTVFAQGHFDVGDNVISAGIGLGSALGSYSYSNQSPGISANFEHGVWEVGGPGVVSLGGYVGIKSFKYEYSSYFYSYSQKWSYTVIGVRGAYHYNGIKSDKFDVYGGAMISYNILSYTYEDSDPYYDYSGGKSYGSNLYVSPYIGGRYYMSENFGFYGELGYGIAYLNLGISLKF